MMTQLPRMILPEPKTILPVPLVGLCEVVFRTSRSPDPPLPASHPLVKPLGKDALGPQLTVRPPPAKAAVLAIVNGPLVLLPNVAVPPRMTLLVSVRGLLSAQASVA